MTARSEVLLRRILVVNVAFLVIAAVSAAMLIPPLRSYLRRAGRRPQE